MSSFEITSLPDPQSSPKASRRDRLRARKALAEVPDYFDIKPEQRGAAQEQIAAAIRLDPHNSHGWFNLGIHLKVACQWEATALCNTRAIQLTNVGEGSPEFWNLGIAGTAMRDWETARYAWTGYGVPLTPGSGEVVEDFGPCPVRIFAPQDSGAEVVWGFRVGPARIRIDSVPLPQSGHRWHDIVLHDGAPNGQRTAFGRDFPVFDELERWQASDVATLECLVRGEDAAVVDLVKTFRSAHLGAEDWTSSVEMLCRECSEGHPSRDHKHGNFLAAEDGRIIGIAAPSEVAEEILDTWVAGARDRTRSDVFNAEEPR